MILNLEEFFPQILGFILLLSEGVYTEVLYFPHLKLGAWLVALTNAVRVGWSHCKAIHNYLWKVMVTERGSWRLEESKCQCHLQEGQAGRSRELQAGQLHLYSWENDKENSPENHFQRCAGEKGDWELSAWIYWREMTLANLIAFVMQWLPWWKRGKQWT